MLLKTFVNDGSLVEIIQQIRFFVSFQQNTLRLLISGHCPTCGAIHLRDICNVMYVRDVIQPIIKESLIFFYMVEVFHSFLRRNHESSTFSTTNQVCDGQLHINNYQTNHSQD